MVDCKRRRYWADGLSSELVAADSIRVADNTEVATRRLDKLSKCHPFIHRQSQLKECLVLFTENRPSTTIPSVTLERD